MTLIPFASRSREVAHLGVTKFQPFYVSYFGSGPRVAVRALIQVCDCCGRSTLWIDLENLGELVSLMIKSKQGSNVLQIFYS